ncbi:MAG TPA: hypothetical protein VFC46_15475, partial [Humisphaera sp.]|nr:hypothetical protein [Humisphaera sp.]
QQIVRDDSDRAVLAAFAIGGDAGIPMRAVSEALSMRQVDVRQIVTSLGAGGVVEEINELLQVRPSVLRGVLVRDVFFCGSRSIDANRLLELGAAAPTAHVLLDAYQRGATVPLDLLCSLILRANRRDVWEHFAFADERCARLIIEQYPSHAIDAAPGLLHFVPDRVLPILLNSGIASEQHATANEDDRRRRVHEWLVPEPILPGEAAKRRRLLHAALANGMRTGQCPPDMCAWALAEILCTHYHLTRTKAGSGMTMVMTRGILPTPDIAEICALWPSILELFSILPRRSQKVVLSQIEDWCFPGRFIFGFEAEPEAYSLLESNSQRMLMDVLALPTCGNACRLWAARISRWAKFQTPFAEPVGLLPTLFADRDHTRDWRQEMEDRDAELRALAARLREQPVGEAAGELASVEREADEFGGLGGYDRQNLYFRVAQLTADPTLWLSQLVDHRMKPEFIGSFVCALSPITFPEYESTLLRLLSDDLYAQIVARIALQLPNPSEAILDSAASRLQPPPRRQDGFHTGMEVSVPAMRRLLRHPNPQIRSDVVIYEWVKTKGQIRPEIAELWRVALVDVDGDEYQLEEIFQRNNELAFEWTSARIQHAHHDLWRHIRGIQLAAEVLDRNQRGELLRSFNGENYNDDCVDLLLQDDAELFNRWLCMHREDYFRLGPLDRVVGPRWEQRALTALDSGVSPQELTEHCTPHHWGGCGPLSQHFKAALPPYEALANHHDERLRSVGEWGLKQVRADYETARRQENIEAIRGR